MSAEPHLWDWPTVFATLLAVVVTGWGSLSCAHADEAAICGEIELREGPIPGSRLRLGKPVLFDDEVGISSGQCFPLFDEATLLTWVHALHRAGPRIYLQRCETIPSEQGDTPDSKSGAIAEDYVELVFNGDRQPVFANLSTPDWSEFSNPSFCGVHMAYWGTKFEDGNPVKIAAIVVDLSNGRVLVRDFVGSVSLESDSRDIFERPHWDYGGRGVSFCGANFRLAKGQGSIQNHRYRVVADGVDSPFSRSLPAECH